MGHPQRLRIIAKLAEGRLHVSELARQLGMSRPLLYMHLAALEKAGLVTGHLELSPDGRALKHYENNGFDLRINVDTVTAAVRDNEAQEAPADPEEAP